MAVEVILPKVDMAMEEGSIQAWHAADGEAVREGQLLFEIGTDKSVMEVEAPASGILRRLRDATDEPIGVGTVVALILMPGEDEAAARPGATGDQGSPPGPASVLALPPATIPAQPPATAPADMSPGAVRATPRARRLARDAGLPIARIAGSGPRGRIGARDVERARGTRPPVSPKGGRLEPFSPVRRIVAARLSESMRTAPHFYMSAQMEMRALQQARRSLAPAVEAASGMPLSLTVLLAFLVGRVLARHPVLNAAIEGEAIRFHDAVHVGIATDRDGELLVPVLHRCDTASLADLNRAFLALRGRVRDRTITSAEMRGGTFTISNLGMYGIDGFTAIINPPEAAILAIGRTMETPVGRDGQVVLRPMATFSLSSDHRIVDGAAAARFMADLREAIESAELLYNEDK